MITPLAVTGTPLSMGPDLDLLSSLPPQCKPECAGCICCRPQGVSQGMPWQSCCTVAAKPVMTHWISTLLQLRNKADAWCLLGGSAAHCDSTGLGPKKGRARGLKRTGICPVQRLERCHVHCRISIAMAEFTTLWLWPQHVPCIGTPHSNAQ
jgi:hypothetical protein